MIMSQCARLSSRDEICIGCINAAILISVIYKFRGPRVLRLNQKALCCLKLQYETMKINSFNSRLQTQRRNVFPVCLEVLCNST